MLGGSIELAFIQGILVGCILIRLYDIFQWARRNSDNGPYFKPREDEHDDS